MMYFNRKRIDKSSRHVPEEEVTVRAAYSKHKGASRIHSLDWSEQNLRVSDVKSTATTTIKTQDLLDLMKSTT